MQPQAAADQRCVLCGLPLNNGGLFENVAGDAYAFCCPGCRHVFLLLSSATGALPKDFRGTDLFRACIAAGIIPDPELANKDVTPCQGDVEPLPFKMRVEGMWCPSCSWVLEEVLKRTPGITDVSVAFVTDRVQGAYLPHIITIEGIQGIAKRLGYKVVTESNDGSGEKKELLLRVSLSAILTAQVMMISMGLDGGFFARFSLSEVRYLSVPLLFLAAPVLFWCGYPILKKGLSALLHRSPSMDTLVAVAALSSFVYSAVRLFQGGIHLYFDTATMLVTFVLFGRSLETWLREKVLADVRGLYEITRAKVRVIDGQERWVRPEELPLDARFEVRAGEAVPLDGWILDGRALIDESILSGEPRPVNKRPGDQVLSGSVVVSGSLSLQKKRSGRDSFVGQVLSLVEQAIANRDRHEVLADTAARIFVPAIFCVAAVSCVTLCANGFQMHEVLLRGLTVLLIACPCALGIAMPIIKVAVVSVARRQGIVIREPNAIDQVRKLDVMVLDKTGTLTEGTFRLQEILTDGIIGESDTLARLAAVERLSSHHIAREIMRAASERELPELEVEAFQSYEGLGVSGTVENTEIFIGSRRLLEDKAMELPTGLRARAEEKERRGMTVVFYGWSHAVQGLLFFGDRLKENARVTVSRMKSSGIAVWIVSGDSVRTTQAVAEQVGAARYIGQAIPAEKSALIQRLQEEGHKVGMVGDGINDAPAIAQADVGFAIASSNDIVRQASDITLLTSEPAALNTAFDLSLRSSRAVVQNLSFAFVYNVCALPLAIGGLLNPPIAVCLMFASSLTVTANALRLFRQRDRMQYNQDAARAKRTVDFKVSRPEYSGNPCGVVTGMVKDQ